MEYVLNLDFIFNNWKHDESIDQYWIETVSHGFINYLPDENTFIVNEGTNNEYTTNLNEVASILNMSLTASNEESNLKELINDTTILKARDTFNNQNKKSAFRLDKKFSYIAGEMSERSKVEELAKSPLSTIELEGKNYTIWIDDKGTGVSKVGAEYFQFIKEFNESAVIA